MKINVLVYSGSGSTVESVRHCLLSLRQILSSNYAVIPVTERMILKEPWTKSCALLVFPGGADTGYCNSLNGDGNRIIEQYVRRGGAYLGFCAGGYYGSNRCEFEVGNKPLEIVGPRELSFFPGTCRGPVFKGFKYDSEAGAKAANLLISKQSLVSDLTPLTLRCYHNGGGVFVDAASYANKGVEILASYLDPLDVDSGDGSAAVIYCKVSEGRVILTGPHPEFAAANLDVKSKTPHYLEMIKALSEYDHLRVKFLEACLVKLGMTVNKEEISVASLTPLHLSSLDSQLVHELITTWEPIITRHSNGDGFINAENDTFCLKNSDSNRQLESSTKYILPSEINEKNRATDPLPDSKFGVDNTGQLIDHNSIIKQVIPHCTVWPETIETPCFNHHTFYEHLITYQDENGSEAKEFGKYILYGEIVTSTNTMLEKNSKLLARLPTGFTFTATNQLAGRGRGSNLWVSPTGSLTMSVCVKYPKSNIPASSVVFIQYIAAIAIVQGVLSYEKEYGDLPIKIKWPNDIYVKDPSKLHIKCDDNNKQQLYVKIGGILVSSSYSRDDGYNLVVGIGLNTANTAPTTSLNDLLVSWFQAKNRNHPSKPTPLFTREKLLARILTRFETLFKRFCRTGFDSYLHALYYSYWLHTDQVVTLETEGGVRARVKGITSDWGLLKVEELSSTDRPTGKILELQCDSNSFDFFKGLLKTKS